MPPVQDLNNLYFFAKVVDSGSYTAAAKALGLQTSKLSRRIAALETELGVRLINRTLGVSRSPKRARHSIAIA
jgi:DNA-binding transcriptional LysR family regulator